MKFFEKLFKLKKNGTTIKTELIGGLVTFVAMCYVLPLNASIMEAMGMDSAGVFVATALVSFLVTLIMGLVANYPIALSAGMGLNAYLVYSVALGFGFSWQESLILLTIAGILFFVISFTPFRQAIIEKMPKDLKFIISAGLGAFIAFIGLKNSGIIVSNASTLVGLGQLSQPAVLIALIGAILAFGLMFVKKNGVAKMAIPIAILFTAIVGVSIYLIIYYSSGQDASNTLLKGLPVVPWLDESVRDMWGGRGLENVIFFGFVGNDKPEHGFWEMLGSVLSNPGSYIAIFSMTFVNLFDTTSTFLAVGKDAGALDENGKMRDYTRAVFADATGSLICAPLGTSTVTSYAESGVGVSLGARTGLASVMTAIMFLLAAFIFPVFSIFTSFSVTAPALIAVGGMIFVNNFKEVNFSDKIASFTAFITVIMILLTYSISYGLGLGLIFYCVMMLFARRGKEIPLIIYITTALFFVAFAANEIIRFL